MQQLGGGSSAAAGAEPKVGAFGQFLWLATLAARCLSAIASKAATATSKTKTAKNNKVTVCMFAFPVCNSLDRAPLLDKNRKLHAQTETHVHCMRTDKTIPIAATVIARLMRPSAYAVAVSPPSVKETGTLFPAGSPDRVVRSVSCRYCKTQDLIGMKLGGLWTESHGHWPCGLNSIFSHMATKNAVCAVSPLCRGKKRQQATRK